MTKTTEGLWTDSTTVIFAKSARHIDGGNDQTLCGYDLGVDAIRTTTSEPQRISCYTCHVTERIRCTEETPTEPFAGIVDVPTNDGWDG